MREREMGRERWRSQSGVERERKKGSQRGEMQFGRLRIGGGALGLLRMRVPPLQQLEVN